MHVFPVWFLVVPLLAFKQSATAQGPEQDRAPRFLIALDSRLAPVDIDRTPLLGRRLSLSLDGATIKEALGEIGRQSGLQLAYGDDVLPPDGRVDLRAEGITVAAALTDVLFGTDVDVVFSPNGRATLVRRPDSAQGGTVAGRVTDAKSGHAIPSASVFLEGTRWRATTDESGAYKLAEVTPGSYTLTASRIGYARQSQSVMVVGGQQATVEVRLEISASPLDAVVVTGTLVPTEVKALPSPVSVITAADIEGRQPRSFTDVFRQAVPSAVAWDNSGIGPSQTAMSVRGASSLSGSNGQMKVYLDGIEISNEVFAAIDPSSIDHIEIVRGPQAATLYGSDAIGGVTQVFTKRGDSTSTRPHVDVSSALGFVQTPYAGYNGALRQDHKAFINGGTAQASYNIGGGYTHSGDWAPETNGSLPSLFGGARMTQGPLSLDISGRYYVQNYASNGYNPNLANTGSTYYSKPFYLEQQNKEQTYGARVTFAATTWWTHTLTVGFDRFDVGSDNTRPRLTTPSDTLLSVQQYTQSKASVGYNTSALFHLSPDVSANILAGADHYTLLFSSFSNSATPTTTNYIPGSFGYRSQVTSSGYFAQGQLNFSDAVFLTAGLRADQNSTFGADLGTPVSPRFGATFVHELAATTLKLRASYGQGIRPPLPGERDGSSSPYVVTLANPLLAPERQKGADAGIDLIFGARGSLSATYYNQTAEDLIQYVLVNGASSPPTYQNQNVGRVKNAGLELESMANLGVATLRAQYAYTRSRVEDLGPNYGGDLRVGDQVLLVPKHTAGATVTMSPTPGTRLTGGITYVGSWTNTDVYALIACFGGTGPCQSSGRGYWIQYPSIVKVNLQVNQRLTGIVSAFVSVDNLTNSDAYEYSNGHAVMGRVTMLGLHAHY